ncbi:MAG: hypothetical protein RMJ51_06450 [Candidatus Calescibacterium sp.]|nr:hypothetical protein [Candidatus Calescibacterium sp.]MCX7971650.1 hypothetical protein [bacterium]MDW8195858.1 hypothetical protein [Candidatus Calescibacterium sp.]
MKLDYIKNHTFFHEQKEEYTEKIIEISSPEAFSKDHRITNEGFGDDKFFTIVSGPVEAKSMDIPLQVLRMIWSSLIPNR